MHKKKKTIPFRGDHFLFGSVFFKKNNQTGFFKTKKPETDRFQFDLVILEQKPIQNGFFCFGSVFSSLAWFFFRFGFGFFGFRLIKLKPNQTIFLKF
jgi:hypothetical protein